MYYFNRRHFRTGGNFIIPDSTEYKWNLTEITIQQKCSPALKTRTTIWIVHRSVSAHSDDQVMLYILFAQRITWHDHTTSDYDQWQTDAQKAWLIDLMVNKLGNVHSAIQIWLVNLTSAIIETMVTMLTLRKTVT